MRSRQFAQCENGHLFCADCLRRLFDAAAAEASSNTDAGKCSVCRCVMSREHAIRNRFAESMLVALPVPCAHEDAGCEEVLRFGDAAKHAV